MYYIHAFEATYGGLHGIEDHYVYDGTYGEAESIACDLSIDVMDQHGIDPSDGEADDFYHEAYEDNIAYGIYKIKPEKEKLGEVELTDLAFHLGSEYFIKEYCEKECF